MQIKKIYMATASASALALFLGSALSSAVWISPLCVCARVLFVY